MEPNDLKSNQVKDSGSPDKDEVLTVSTKSSIPSSNTTEAVDSTSSLTLETSLTEDRSLGSITEKDGDHKGDPKSLRIEKEKVEDAQEKPKSKEDNAEGDRAQYVHYEGDVAVYTDPQSRQQFIWDKEKNEWKMRQVDYDFDGTNYFYTDKAGNKYKWDTVSNSWVSQTISSVPLIAPSNVDDSDDETEYDENNAKKTAPPILRQDMSKGSYGYEGDTHTYTDATDGTVYVWDKEKNAWFPKVDDDFLARYQMSYGFVDNSSTEDEKKIKPELEQNKEEVKNTEPVSKEVNEQPVPGQKRKPEPPKWFDVGQESTKVYVSNLPLDLTQEEFVDVMQKCGLVVKDIDTNQMKIKMYNDINKHFKGDALCTYIKRESVDLALNILDGYEIRGKKMKVERAKFTMKGEAYDPNLKPKKRRKKDLEKLKKAQEKLFDWRPDKLRGERSKNETVIVIKNLFDPAIFDKDVTLILEYQQDMRDECAKCGHVKKVVIHDKHPEGVAQIFFKEAEAADACKELLNGRWFGQRRITAETWDGKTRYKVQETAEEREARLKKWETFLEEEDRKKKQTGEKITVGDENKEEKSDKVEDKEDDGGESDATKSSGDSEGE